MSGEGRPATRKPPVRTRRESIRIRVSRSEKARVYAALEASPLRTLRELLLAESGRDRRVGSLDYGQLALLPPAIAALREAPRACRALSVAIGELADQVSRAIAVSPERAELDRERRLELVVRDVQAALARVDAVLHEMELASAGPRDAIGRAVRRAAGG